MFFLNSINNIFLKNLLQAEETSIIITIHFDWEIKNMKKKKNGNW